jgi:tetratricopeptide (TPR) repeat protein
MYPDRAMFQRMVQDEQNLSASGKETILALYDGPLRLRQILEIVNAQGPGTGSAAKEHNITESALRKRLDVLITRGILARAGSERTNPYYYIRRPWIFNQYILTKCRDRPEGGLLDLTVLLHELSQMAASGEAAAQPHPRFISAVGERTERSHQINSAFVAFQKLLGNKNAIGDYLEGVYEDIYDGKVPESDIDGLIARDFLRFVATAPDEEREVRFFLWYADFFHVLDRYQEAYLAFQQGVALASRDGLDLPSILEGTRISNGHLLLHLNDLAQAKEAFLETSQDRTTSPFARAKSLFGAGEAELFSGDLATPYAPARFSQALELCKKADPEGRDPDVQELLADILRRTGTVHRVLGRLDEAGACYTEAEAIYSNSNGMTRGMVWLLPERAELLRARAFRAAPGDAEKFLSEAAASYEEAKTASQRIRNINWFAHDLIGECELARIAHVKFNKPLPKNLDNKYANAFEIYCQISSKWGMVQTFISQALLYHGSPGEFPDKYAVTADKLDQAERFSKELGLKTELALIQRIKAESGAHKELNPLTFL